MTSEVGVKAATSGKASAKRIPSPKTESRKEVALSIGSTKITFPVISGGQGPAFFSLGVRKSGSTMLHRIVHFLSIRNKVNLVDVPSTFFRNGFNVTHWSNIDLTPLIQPANVYTGFRTFPTEIAKTTVYQKGRKIFMFRDPRDALVSQYFSDAYSHDLPDQKVAGEGREMFLKKREEAQSSDIDEWVLSKAGSLRRTLLSFQDVMSDPSCLMLRYEDYIFQKRRMVNKIVLHFDWKIEPAQLIRLLSEVDVVPDSEDKSRFVRKVIPGDHTAKLKVETIRRLNNRLSDVMQLYDYY